MLDLNIIEKFDWKNIGFFRFKKFDDKDYLLTNEVGNYVFLPEADFKKFISGKLSKKSAAYKELQENMFFLSNRKYAPVLISKFSDKYSFLQYGPSLHIIVVTLRCNHKCIYCHASAVDTGSKEFDMDMATAKKIVDTIFKTTNKSVAIEFQGGEPLLNWPVVKFIIQYAKEKNKIEKKDLQLRLVSNFSVMDNEKMKFLMDNEVNFCTSLDGDEETHNYNRIYLQGNSFQKTVEWIKKINEAYKKKYKGKKRNYYRVGALITVSKKTLANYKKVIDTYIKLGFKSIYLRYLNPYGFALSATEKIWYTPQEYINFYKKSLNYILEKNYNGKHFYDFGAVTYLAKILFGHDLNNLDMRSPCGAVIGQLAYNYNGDVYTCDEGRMLAKMGDQMFRLGNINENTFEQLINNNLCKSICLASSTHGLPGYNDDVYQPYIGICPVYNYSVYKNIFQSSTNNVKYQIDKAIIEYIFEKLKNRKNKDIFTEWVKKSKPLQYLKTYTK
ncbi:His-Xaa-Ser system radical SAM maturase HxsB [Candidatus Falkowbacteria bacterium]|nr:His-Xaa-Ser system radical SAM maturase HxsB [Candidatus Falkowbacteria bacterium]